MQRRTRRQWLIALFGLGCLLFSYPLLELFNSKELLGGIPLSVMYLFMAWLAVVGLTLLIHERRG